MYKKDLVLNILQWLICHKTKRNQTKYKKNTVCTTFYRYEKQNVKGYRRCKWIERTEFKT